ncbi:uncharacterized protein LOC124945746 [Impatiens glandulifera]|uniref:uncharacterized protein LOC124945746 n=1 Tax=Impatiens glandulifera TaxID=253017 RepID=UPI001FB08E71|nr:uncharacterized protein LOC124945746 [Impatiens glandulifera]
MMQRWLPKLRSFAALNSIQTPNQTSFTHISRRLLHLTPQPITSTRIQSDIFFSRLGSSFNGSNTLQLNQYGYGSSLLPHSFVQVRHLTKKEMKAKMKKFKPRTPITSKLKKYKLKGYSSFKDRFKAMPDGTIRRWKAGKRHNAHLKSKSAKRRLRKPGVVPLAYAKVMKKLNFC